MLFALHGIDRLARDADPLAEFRLAPAAAGPFFGDTIFQATYPNRFRTKISATPAPPISAGQTHTNPICGNSSAFSANE